VRRVPFSLGTFSWASKKKYLAQLSETHYPTKELNQNLYLKKKRDKNNRQYFFRNVINRPSLSISNCPR
jgi:hypothetical protein